MQTSKDTSDFVEAEKEKVKQYVASCISSNNTSLHCMNPTILASQAKIASPHPILRIEFIESNQAWFIPSSHMSIISLRPLPKLSLFRNRAGLAVMLTGRYKDLVFLVLARYFYFNELY